MTTFDEVKATFWRAWEDDGPATPVTAQAVEAAERELGVTLPEALLELLRVRDGGVVADAWDAHPTSGTPEGDYVPFDELMGVGPRDRTCSLLDTPYLVREWELPSPVVLLSGDGHTWIALDYRACGPHGEPSVVWLEAGFGTEQVLAPGFRTFVTQLTASASYYDPET